MASTTNNRESALRASLLALLHDTTQGMDSAPAIADAIASALRVVHATIADFAQESNRTRRSVLWNRLPAELKLQTVRWLPPGQHAAMMGVSRDVRRVIVSDSSHWTTITLPRRDMDQAERVDFLITMIARSRCRAVDLDWKIACATPSTSPDPSRDLVLPPLQRARTAVLHPSYFQSGPQTFWDTSTPLLESLTISDGTPDSSVAVDASWPSKDLPRLRKLKLDAATFDTQPVATPFANVEELEATMGVDADRHSWAHIWDSFPHLERLVAHVDIVDDFAAIPSPPPSVRHVTLVGPNEFFFRMCHIVRGWAAHRVRVLEIFSSNADALPMAVEYLQKCGPGLWTAALVPSCCPERDSHSSIIMRGERASVVLRAQSADDHLAQIMQFPRSPLFNRLETLTLSRTFVAVIFKGNCTFPALRRLTVVGTMWMLRLAVPLPPDLFRVPALERLVIDVSRERDPCGRLHIVPAFLRCIGHPRLRDVTFRLPACLRGQDSATIDCAVARVRAHLEFASPEQQHDHPRNLSRTHAD